MLRLQSANTCGNGIFKLATYLLFECNNRKFNIPLENLSDTFHDDPYVAKKTNVKAHERAAQDCILKHEKRRR